MTILIKHNFHLFLIVNIFFYVSLKVNNILPIQKYITDSNTKIDLVVTPSITEHGTTVFVNHTSGHEMINTTQIYTQLITKGPSASLRVLAFITNI